MAVKITTDGNTTTYAGDGATYNGDLVGTNGNDELVVDNGSVIDHTPAGYYASIVAYNGSDTVTVASGGEVEGSINAGANDGLGDTITVTDGSTVFNSVLTGNGNDTVSLAGQIGDGQTSDRITTGEGEDSVTIGSTANINVSQIHMGSGASTLRIEDGAQVSLRPSSNGAGIYTEAGNDNLYLGGTYSNYTGNDVDTYYGSDYITLGSDFSFQNPTGGDGEFLIMGRDDTDGSDTDTLNLYYLQDRIDSHVEDGENGTITLDDGSVIRYIGIESIDFTCFTRGTRIAVAEGDCVIEDLREGELVLTRDNGLQPIRWIGSRKLSAAELDAFPKLRPILIRAGALGKNTPENDLMVSPQHRILVRSKIARRMFGTDELLVAAKHLTEIDGIEIAEHVNEVEYIHILFDRHEIVISNGAETESLYTGQQALKSVGAAAREEIFFLFPELKDPDTAMNRCPARPLVPQGMGKRLAARHSRHHSALVA